MATGVDAVAAYTVDREVESVAGQNVTAELGDRIEALGGRIDTLAPRMEGFDARIDAVAARMETANAQLFVQFQTALTAAVAEIGADISGIRTEVAVLKREVRLIWAFLFLLVPTITAFLVRLFAA